MALSTHFPIKVAVADYCPLIRQTICSYLQEMGSFEIAIQASDGAELIRGLQKTRELPDICVLDINMPVKNGYETVKEIKTNWPGIKILVLTLLDNEYAIVQMLKYGADGYMLKNCYPDDIRKALVSIYNVGSYENDLTIKYAKNAMRGDAHSARKITEKEMQFLSFCCSELSYKEIAQKLCVSPRTVEGYRDGLFEKLQIKSRSGLIMYAVRIGLISYCFM